MLCASLARKCTTFIPIHSSATSCAAFPNFPSKRLPGHLRVTTLPQPAVQTLRFRANQGIAFRVRDDRPQPRELQMMQRLIHRRRNRIVGKLYQQVVLLVQREAAGNALNLLQVFKTQVKVASGGKSQAPFDTRLQFWRVAELINSGTKACCGCACGVAITCVMPSVMAISAISSDISMESGPSSRPASKWQ